MDMNVVTEEGKAHLRYVGRYGPQANTELGLMWWGDCVAVDLKDVDYFMTSGDWMLLSRGRCKGIMKHSLERCIQEAERGSHFCPLHRPEDNGGEV